MVTLPERREGGRKEGRKEGREMYCSHHQIYTARLTHAHR